MTRKALDMTRQIIKRGTRALKKADSSVTDVAPVSTENSGYFSFHYSYREISAHGSVARVRGRDTRFENGKLSSEAFEGNIDRQQFDRMLAQAQGAFMNQAALVLKSLFWFLPSVWRGLPEAEASDKPSRKGRTFTP